jgi:hypothetical protein
MPFMSIPHLVRIKRGKMVHRNEHHCGERAIHSIHRNMPDSKPMIRDTSNDEMM